MPEAPKDAPSGADAMVAVGTVIAAVSVGALAGVWWGLLFLGLVLMAAGTIRAVTE